MHALMRSSVHVAHRGGRNDPMQIQIKPDGDWHRRSALGAGTACGARFEAFASRDDGFNRLCPGCFTEQERDRGLEHVVASETDLHISRFDDRDDPTDPSGAATIAAIERGTL